jgi:hypothetical protein
MLSGALLRLVRLGWSPGASLTAGLRATSYRYGEAILSIFNGSVASLSTSWSKLPTVGIWEEGRLLAWAKCCAPVRKRLRLQLIYLMSHD